MSISLCEEMGIQCKLSTTNGWWAELWWKCITNGWGCNVETPSAELCSCRRDKHVMAFCWTKIYPNRNTCDWDADVVEVGRTVLADTVKRRDCYFELYSMWHWQPMKTVAWWLCSYLPTPTTKRAAAFRTIWSWRMPCEETPYRKCTNFILFDDVAL